MPAKLNLAGQRFGLAEKHEANLCAEGEGNPQGGRGRLRSVVLGDRCLRFDTGPLGQKRRTPARLERVALETGDLATENQHVPPKAKDSVKAPGSEKTRRSEKLLTGQDDEEVTHSTGAKVTLILFIRGARPPWLSRQVGRSPGGQVGTRMLRWWR